MCIILINVQNTGDCSIHISMVVIIAIFIGLLRNPFCKTYNVDSGLCLKTKFHLQNVIVAAVCSIIVIDVGLIFQWIRKIDVHMVSFWKSFNFIVLHPISKSLKMFTDFAEHTISTEILLSPFVWRITASSTLFKQQFY